MLGNLLGSKVMGFTVSFMVDCMAVAVQLFSRSFRDQLRLLLLEDMKGVFNLLGPGLDQLVGGKNAFGFHKDIQTKLF